MYNNYDNEKKRVRILLRVSSDQQLDADGDLSVQRKIIQEYIDKNDNWEFDGKEYFEGGVSAYKNTANQRDVLQEILKDAKKHELDILVAYKDDRIGRLISDTPQYILELKKYDVDIFTAKDGRITPNSLDSIEEIMMLNFRYANAHKSSKDTSVRVSDAAQKLVQGGKFMGGAAPYGYKLEDSNQKSKHGRILKKLVVVPERAEVVKYIYHLSLDKEFGSAKIAKTLNEHEDYKNLPPKDVWKSGVITSILTNPIYAGYMAYKRRERIGKRHHRLDSKDWVLSFEAKEELIIIDEDTWNKVQERRKARGDKYIKKLEHKDVNVIKRNDGMLPLVDVLHCGYCGCKTVNGSKYNYWTIKGTGEKRASKVPIYKCQMAWQGVPHDKTKAYKAENIEPIIFNALSEYIGILRQNEDVFKQIEQNQNAEKKKLEMLLKREKMEFSKLQKKIDVMESHIPDAMTEDYPLSLEALVSLINKHKSELKKQQEVVTQKELDYNNASVHESDWLELKKKIPTWQEVFLNADVATKRVLVNKLIERIDVRKDEVIIRFKINLDDFFLQSRITHNGVVPQPGL